MDCTQCQMPLTDDNKCSCDETVCYHCCSCDESCDCGCKTRDK
ncbi:MAG: hypothetical protein WCT37_04145 [Patescibacteria group bacterium]